MIDLISKRYVKAILLKTSSNHLESIVKSLRTLNSLYKNDKFLFIILSKNLESNKKVDFILSTVDNLEESIKNLIKLLGKKNRLEIIPTIFKELTSQLSVLNNNYVGSIHSNSKLNSDSIKLIESKFSKKFNINLSLTQNKSDYDGIKVDISGLDVEVSFSKVRLKNQIINDILKSI
jgi:F-type H+-transporting ATPase subunit delta